jgi:hypothetical protein
MLRSIQHNEAFDVVFLAQQFRFSTVAENLTAEAWQSIVLKNYQIF